MKKNKKCEVETSVLFCFPFLCGNVKFPLFRSTKKPVFVMYCVTVKI